jgi:hypothetical protein
MSGTQCHRASLPPAGYGCTTITIISAEIILAERSSDETDASGRIDRVFTLLRRALKPRELS